MYYLDIIDQFKTIEDVFVGRNYADKVYYVRVRGTNEKGFHDYYGTYQHYEVAQKVGEKISYFIGV